MTTAGLRVDGAPELARGLDRVADELGDLSKPGGEAANDVLDRARATAPVDTGELVSSLQAAAYPDYVEVVAGAPHAPFIHYGVPSRNIEPNPFLAGALEAEESRVIDVYAGHVQDLLDRVEGI